MSRNNDEIVEIDGLKREIAWVRDDIANQIWQHLKDKYNFMFMLLFLFVHWYFFVLNE